MSEKVVVIEIHRPGTEPDPFTVVKVGSDYATHHAEWQGRLGDAKPGWVTSINRVSLPEHIEDTARRHYLEQFQCRHLQADLLNDIYSHLDVGDEIVLKVKEITPEEWAEIEARGDGSDCEEEDEGAPT